jgi:hypothetical protein
MSTADEPTIYHIRLKGHLNTLHVQWTERITITLVDNGETLLTCVVADQAALHGLLRKIRDLGIPLLAVIAVVDRS